MDEKPQATIEIFNEAKPALELGIAEYLEWMALNAYAQNTKRVHSRVLSQFLSFIKAGTYPWNEIFTGHTLRRFQKIAGSTVIHAVTGLARYLYSRGKIAQPIQLSKSMPPLPIIYEDYLLYQKKYRQTPDVSVRQIRRVLCAFDGYCQQNGIELQTLKIEHVDAFRDVFFNNFASTTRGLYRGYLRGFLRYLYQERQILTSDLAAMVVGRREYAQARPPQFLRPVEVEKLFASPNSCSASGLRTYAIVHLAYTMGLRPCEISHICLDDICFGRQLLRLTSRKGGNPVELPIPEHTLKALAAYIIGARPTTSYRRLFLTLDLPYRPLSPNAVGCRISRAMKQSGLNATAYWMRHTYAQSLLEAGASIFEIKEMLGHDKIESTKRYLRVHTKLMRQVLFDEIL